MGLKWVVGKPTCQSKLPGSAGHEEEGDADATWLGFPDGITGEQVLRGVGGEGAVVLWC